MMKAQARNASRIALLGLVLGWTGVAQASGLNIALTPIIGYEQNEKLIPQKHTVKQITYGARLTAGRPLLSLEGEYTKGTYGEAFPAKDLTVAETSQKAKVGLRSQIHLLGGIRLIARAGVAAQQLDRTEIEAGETTITKVPIVPKPYGGAGLRFGLSSQISFVAEVVAVFHKWPDMKANTYETTAGLQISIH